MRACTPRDPNDSLCSSALQDGHCVRFHLFMNSDFQVDAEPTESVVTVDWENGFVEASAKTNENVNKVICNLLISLHFHRHYLVIFLPLINAYISISFRCFSLSLSRLIARFSRNY